MLAKKLVCVLFLLFVSYVTAHAATLIHDFQFNDNLVDSMSPAATMTVFGSPNTQGYSNDGYLGARTWYWTKNTNTGAGLCMHTNIANSTSYSLGFRVKFGSVPTGYRKLVTFKGHQANHSFTSDNGIYVLNGVLVLYVNGSVSSTFTVSADTVYDIILTKNGTSVIIYAAQSGSTLLSMITYTDTGGAITSENVFGLFYDDTSNGHEYFPGGFVDVVRVWDGVLSAGEMAQNLFTPFYYRTKASGNWHDATTWQKSNNNLDWVDSDDTPMQDAINVHIQTGHTVTLTNPASVTNLTLDGGTINLGSQTLDIAGVLQENSGSISGGSPQVNGYSSPDTQYLSIAASGNIISGFGVNTIVNEAMYPNWIKRYWQIDGTFSGSKLVTFYWTADDDNNYDWVGMGVLPLIYKANVSLAVGAFDVSSNPRWLNAFVNESLSKANYTITTDTHTLPVELSSFLAVLTAEHFVELKWTTQSESNVAGYYLYRSDSDDLAAAQGISPMITATNTSSVAQYRYLDQEVEPGTWYYWLQNMDINGHFAFHGPVFATVNPLTDPGVPNVQMRSGIHSVYPNPFSKRTNISYGLAEKANVELKIFNIRGTLVKTILIGEKNLGMHTFDWDGTDSLGNDCASGIYYFRLSTGVKSSIAKVVLVK